jgi:hypothetical protein
MRAGGPPKSARLQAASGGSEAAIAASLGVVP